MTAMDDIILVRFDQLPHVLYLHPDLHVYSGLHLLPINIRASCKPILDTLQGLHNDDIMVTNPSSVACAAGQVECDQNPKP